jgi:hypothetical protein
MWLSFLAIHMLELWTWYQLSKLLLPHNYITIFYPHATTIACPCVNLPHCNSTLDTDKCINVYWTLSSFGCWLWSFHVSRTGSGHFASLPCILFLLMKWHAVLLCRSRKKNEYCIYGVYFHINFVLCGHAHVVLVAPHKYSFVAWHIVFVYSALFAINTLIMWLPGCCCSFVLD